MRRFALFLGILLVYSSMPAQIVGFSEFERNFASSVTSIDEFIARFNGERNNPLIEERFRGDTLNMMNILSLFDIRTKDNFAMNHPEEVEQFVRKVISQEVKLNVLDEDFVIEIPCNAQFQKKNEVFTIFLRPEIIDSSRFKWVIVGVKGDFLQFSEQQPGMMIMPHENSLNFLNMRMLLESDPSAITSLLNQGCTLDPISVFCFLIEHKLLKIVSMPEERVTYHFFQIPGCVFSVNRLVRDDTNSGWLITNIVNVADGEKAVFLRTLMNN